MGLDLPASPPSEPTAIAADTETIRPLGHPAHLPWPPKLREYPPDHPARRDEESNQSFNWDWAVEDFGNEVLEELEAKQGSWRDFMGDWWMLAFLRRLESLPRPNDPAHAGDNRSCTWRDVWMSACVARVCIHLEGANLLESHLEHIILRRAHLEHTNLTKAHLDYTNLRNAHLEYATLNEATCSHADLGDARFEHTDFLNTDFKHANLYRVHLKNAQLVSCNFEHADLRASHLENAKLGLSHFKNANLISAHLTNADMRLGHFEHASLHAADLSGATTNGARFIATRGLFGKLRATTPSAPIHEHDAQQAIYHDKYDLASWELLRIIGGLRIFGVSYFSVALITLYVGLAQKYNEFAAQSREVVRELDGPSTSGESLARLAFDAAARVPDLPAPGHLGRQLVFTIVLAVAATIYAMACPSEVKEANEVRWTRAMGQPLWEYRSANWSRIWWRYACAILFAIGGAHSLIYLITRSWHAVRFLLWGT